MNRGVADSPYVLVLLTYLLGMAAFFLIVLVENGRVSIDSPIDSIEISMIGEGRSFEYSGRPYANRLALVEDGVFPSGLAVAGTCFGTGVMQPWKRGTKGAR
jgi:hypothetical protein